MQSRFWATLPWRVMVVTTRAGTAWAGASPICRFIARRHRLEPKYQNFTLKLELPIVTVMLGSGRHCSTGTGEIGVGTI